MVQMANRFGLRQTFNRAVQRIRRDRNPFRVRYWSPRALLETFTRVVGPTTLAADGFFSLNAQAADLDLLRRHHAAVVRLSEGLRRASGRIPSLILVSDSLLVRSANEPSHAHLGSTPGGGKDPSI